jgi:hypothetical protein
MEKDICLTAMNKDLFVRVNKRAALCSVKQNLLVTNLHH